MGIGDWGLVKSYPVFDVEGKSPYLASYVTCLLVGFGVPQPLPSNVTVYLFAVHVAEYDLSAVGGFTTPANSHAYPVLVAVGFVMFPPVQ